MNKNNINIALVQDIYTDKHTGRPLGLNSKWTVAKTKDHGIRNVGTRAAILTNLNITPITIKEAEYTVAVCIDTQDYKFNIINSYAPPKTASLTNILHEIGDIIKKNKGNILFAGDMNAHSPQWGYADIDARGHEMMDFLSQYNLITLNDPNAEPTFSTPRCKGWPDITASTSPFIQHIEDWEVQDEITLSDHKYITYNISEYDTKAQRPKLETKLGKHKKFDRLIGKLKSKALKDIKKANTADKLDKAAQLLQQEITAIAQKCYRTRETNRKTQTKWWTTELDIQKNKVKALRRRYQKQADDELREREIQIYRREHAVYKKKINVARRKAWKEFCTKTTENYDKHYKIAAAKVTNPTPLGNMTMGTNTNMKDNMEKIIDTLFMTKDKLPANWDIIKTRTGREIEVSRGELNRIINNIKQNKAPGYDLIDYNLIKRINTGSQELLLALYNKCLQLSHFPKSYKIAKVVLFKKPNKPDNEPQSYRPICLLPVLGKILEGIIHGRITHQLERARHISPLQFGFKTSTSTEHALNHAIKTIRKDRANKKLTTAISFDISGAFDNLHWPSLIKHIENTTCSSTMINIVISFLKDRYVTLKENNIEVKKKVHGGCPQGSKLGPLLWKIAANEILRERWPPHTRIQAFADDFLLIVSGESKAKLVENTNHSIARFSDWADREKLTINWDKTKALYVNRSTKPHKSNNMPADLPGLTLHGRNIEAVDSLKYLGVTLHKNLKWLAHTQEQVKKVYKKFGMLTKMCARTWGTKPKLLKLWYNTAIEKTLTYAAAVWGHELDAKSKKMLTTCQRHYILPCSRAYKTTPTSSVQVLTGVIPIDIKIKYESAVGRTLRLREVVKEFGEEYLPWDYEAPSNIWLKHPAHTIQIKENTNNTTHIYTDGSKTDNGTGLGFVVYEDGKIIHRWNERLGINNSVYQAEIKAVKEAMKWGIANEKSFKIYTDSQAALKSIVKPFNKNRTVMEISWLAEKRGNTLDIEWVKAHVGVEGNEEADRLAKEAAENKDRREESMALPRSRLKRRLYIKAMEEWQQKWDTGDKGRETYNYFPQVSTSRLQGNGHLNEIYTGHGAFPSYLKRFNRINDNKCACGEEGTPYHYMTQCPLTQANHIALRTATNEKAWYKQLTQVKGIRTKLKNIMRWLHDNIDDLVN